MTNLDLCDRAAGELGWPHITSALAARTVTALGKDRALTLGPLPERDKVQRSLGRIEEARRLLILEKPLPMGALEDMRPALERASKEAVLGPAELLGCATLIRASAEMRQFLRTERSQVPLLAACGTPLVDLMPLATRIEAALEPSGALRDNASDALAGYRTRARGLRQEIETRLEAMLHDPEFSTYLRDSYFSVRGERYVLPVNVSFRSKVPGIVHNASQSGQTIFVEPQALSSLGDELAIAQSLATEEERQILAELSAYVGARAADLSGALEALAELDLVQAAAHLATALDAAVPEIAESSAGLRLRALRHPLLLLRGKYVVPNDVVLDATQRALVVSGPNAGGKTVTITAIGLSALMLRAGLPIAAATGSALPLYDGVAAAIGDAQDLARDLSTFSAHLSSLKAILASAGEGWLAVIDEMAGDTDPREGAAIGAAVLDALVERGARVLTTTHLDEIKALALTDARLVNARVGFDPTTLKPTYRLELGAAGVSNAIAIARQVGLPPEIIDRAQASMHESGALALALDQLAHEREALRVERDRLAREREASEMARREAEAARAEAEKARAEAELRVREELASEAAGVRDEVGRLVASLQAEKSMARAQQVQRALSDKASELEHKRARSAALLDGRGAGGELRAGARVKVVSLGQSGEVLAIDGEHVLIAVGTLRTRVKVSDVVVLGRAASTREARGTKARAGGRRGGVTITGGAEGIESGERCDVRGMRADEALSIIERFLDASVLAGVSTVQIIHGHGTGALKQAVRELLARSPYVESFRPGEPQEGGDGASIVTLQG